MKMLLSSILLAMVGSVLTEEESTAELQLVNFRNRTKGPIGNMTTSNGAPIEYNEASSTLNKPLISNEYVMEALKHLVSERIPERVVHAKAGGAFGYFEVTHDITDICKADLFSEVGKKTPIAARFSPLGVDRGGIDTSRDARGFAVKFYTKEGNFDIVGFNTPMYFYKDPSLFPSFVRAQKRNPSSNLIDGNMLWDILTLTPESLHIFILLLGNRGIPDGYRHMPGFGVHTFQVVNKNGENSFIRFHFTPDAGIKNLRTEQALTINGADPDYATRDLYNAIASGKFPTWTVSIQILSTDNVTNAGFDVFDVTKTLPTDIYPLQELGKMVLNMNPVNYFAEIEQMALCPCHLVPGILGGPDKMFEARRLAYRDALFYRLGANYNQIPVNCPMQNRAMTYNRNGVPPVNDNMRDVPNYYPNSFNGPAPYKDTAAGTLIEVFQDAPNNFDQARELYTNEMTSEERCILVENAVSSLLLATDELQDRAVKIFTNIHSDLGTKILQGLQGNGTTSCDDEV